MVQLYIQDKAYQVETPFHYTISGAKSRIETRFRIQVKHIKLRLFLLKFFFTKIFLLRFNSKYLCCGLQGKLIKNPVSRTAQFQVVEISMI